MAVPTPHGAPDDDPAASVPPELARCLRDRLASVAQEVEEEIRRQVPDYAEPGESVDGRLRTGVVQALTLFVDLVCDPGGRSDAITATYYEIGWNAALAGRNLDALQSAVRVGGLHAWRRMGRTADELGLDPALVSTLGELAFRAVHEVTEAAAAGYGDARMCDSEELERRRRSLLDTLLGEPPVPVEVVRRLARGARWAVPERVAVVVFADGGDTGEPFAVPVGALADLRARPPRLLLSDPEGAGRFGDRALDLALRGRRAALGPTVPPAEAARSLRWAVRALRLAERGVLPGQGLLRCADHLSTLLLYDDEELLNLLAARSLRPLDAVPEAQRARLRETLLAWLLGGGNVPEVAARLSVHPQTVRHRLRQLERLFGEALNDPGARLELILALKAAAD